MNDKYDLVIKYLKEMKLNYNKQYQDVIPDMNFVADIIYKEVK